MANEQRLIDQGKVYEMACAGCIRHGETLGECNFDEPCERLVFAFTVAEPVDAVKVVHGRWLSLEEYARKIGANAENYVGGWVFCSECGQQMRELHGWAYCPNCGAKMDGERRTDVQVTD